MCVVDRCGAKLPFEELKEHEEKEIRVRNLLWTQKIDRMTPIPRCIFPWRSEAGVIYYFSPSASKWLKQKIPQIIVGWWSMVNR